MNAPSLTHLVGLLPLLFVSFVLPWYAQSRRGVLFGVTVPLEFADTPEAKSILRRYRVSIFAFALAVLTVVGCVLWLAPSGSAVSIAPVLALFVELGVTFFFWRRGASAVRPYAARIPLERHTDLVPVSTAFPMLATACSLLPLAATALWLRLHWNQIPTRFVLHWNASGIADRWGTRSVDGVFGTLIAGAMTVVLLTGTALFLARANGPLRNQRRGALVPMASLSWLVAGFFCMLGLQPLLHFTAVTILLIGAIYTISVFAVALWLLQRSGLAPYGRSTEPYDSTPDSKWHAGLFYYNPADAAVVVPKRFGWGWTFNFARPTAWVYVGVLLMFILAMHTFVR